TDVDQTRAAAAQKLQMPVLALGGEYSFGSAVAESMSHLASDVQGVIVPNAGHWLNEEQPDFVADQLLTFLR
ncbi:MAG TPA: alpha/beta hydrolase, partial [Ktedonobacteraceae bacterium]|nr:alpha/beta hydrolase [Ktedonobacteraceae bacterium]